MTKDEALDLALEALQYIHEGANNQGPHTGISWRCVAVKAEPAITAIKQARALDKMADNARELGLMPFYGGDYEPVQEPVAWMDRDGDLYANEPDKNWCPPHYPLYTTPPAAQPAPAVPDMLTIHDPETSDYKEGWNECREFILTEMRKI